MSLLSLPEVSAAMLLAFRKMSPDLVPGGRNVFPLMMSPQNGSGCMWTLPHYVQMFRSKAHLSAPTLADLGNDPSTLVHCFPFCFMLGSSEIKFVLGKLEEEGL